ncbi:MAG: SUF system NifU family Fe-S cluster assembly protein [Candidatus Aenigmatarchaeota archaeon]
MSKSEIYQTIILEHYRNPKNYGTIENPTVKYRDSNPLCGDTIEIYLKINDGKIYDIKFSGKGCAISQAGASMLTEKMKNKSLEEAKKFSKEDMIKLFGNINFGPIRIKCALLAYKVFKMALYSYLGLKEEEP